MQIHKHKVRLCPNCMGPVARESSGCVLHALFTVVYDRGALDPAHAEDLHATTDVEALWSELGPIIDRLQAGQYRD